MKIQKIKLKDERKIPPFLILILIGPILFAGCETLTQQKEPGEALVDETLQGPLVPSVFPQPDIGPEPRPQFKQEPPDTQ